LSLKEKLIIAIDGPAGSGKSTTAKLAAKALDYQYIDTGAMYRAVGLQAIKTGIELQDEEKLSKIAKNVKINFEKIDDEQHVFLNEQDITEEIRTPEISDAASRISTFATVRESMVELQRKMGKNGGIVMEGRDIGTVVFPDADIKIFLVASLHERAKRRYAELMQKGMEVDLYNLEKEILARDVRDSSRSNSPLSKAKGSVELDTTDLSIDEQVNRIVEIVKERTGK
jgi:CMP/dCMP kinase